MFNNQSPPASLPRECAALLPFRLLFSAVLRIACFKYPSPSSNRLSGLPPQHLSRTPGGERSLNRPNSHYHRDLAETSVSTRSLSCFPRRVPLTAEPAPALGDLAQTRTPSRTCPKTFVPLVPQRSRSKPPSLVFPPGHVMPRREPSHSRVPRSYCALGAARGAHGPLTPVPVLLCHRATPHLAAAQPGSLCSPQGRALGWGGPGPPLTRLQSPL